MSDIISQGDQLLSLIADLEQKLAGLPAGQRTPMETGLQRIRASACDLLGLSQFDCNARQQTEDELHAAMQRLTVSEENFQRLAESIADPLTIYDAGLHLVYRNAASQKADNISAGAGLGKTFAELYPLLEGGEIHQIYLRALRTSQPQHQLIRSVNPIDSQVIYFDLSVYPNQHGLVTLSKDVTGRILAEESLRKAHADAVWMARFPNENPNPVARVSLAGIILYHNRASAELPGWRFQEGGRLPRAMQSLFKQARVQRKAVMQDVLLGGRTYSITAMPFPEDDYANLYGLDITDRKRVEAALETALAEVVNEKNRLLAVMEALPIGLAIIDQKGGILLTNSGYDEIWGNPRPAANSVDDYKPYQSWWVDTGQPVRPEEWASTLSVARGETIKGQFIRIQRFDGGYAFVINSGAPVRDANGQITGSAVAIMDISEVIETERELRESQERFRVALTAVPLMVYNCDHELRYTWVYNPLPGFQEIDLLGKRDDEVFPAQAASELLAAKQWALNTGVGGVREVKFPVAGADTYFILTVEPVKDQFGEVLGLTCSAIDITEQKRLEIQKQEQAVQLEVQRRLMEYREQERQGIARDLHDGPIQTLAGVGFNLQYIREAFNNPALEVELDQVAHKVKDTIHELRDLMNDLRPPSLIRFGLPRTIKMYAEAIQERHPDILIRLDLDNGDQRLTEQTSLTLFRIFQEGLNNAIRHAGAGKISVCYRIEPEEFVLELHDNGRGFTLNKDLADMTQEGHFGLVGMKERILTVGGHFLVHSEPGKGTTITVRGPLQGNTIR